MSERMVIFSHWIRKRLNSVAILKIDTRGNCTQKPRNAETETVSSELVSTNTECKAPGLSYCLCSRSISPRFVPAAKTRKGQFLQYCLVDRI